MFFRLAVKNVRRSIKDYLVYFITLMLSVCIFYMFNSVDEQFVMLNLSEIAGKGMFDSLSLILGVVSVFVSVVLAFLVIYANGYIMRRRRREIGLYMVLGISAKRTAGMLVVETVLIGILSLAAGLGVGYLGSQAMSVFTAQLFSVQIRDYHFVFSEAAFLKTCIYFGIIFVIVVLFNARNVAKQNLVKLLGSGSRNERAPVKKVGVSIVLLTAGAILIALSYFMVFHFGVVAFLSIFGPALLVNFLGTLCLFYGLSGLYLRRTKRLSRRQLHGLRIFSERQLLSRFNTNAVSMAVICTMLFLTLVIISSVSSLNAVLNRDTQRQIPFDLSVTGYGENGLGDVDVEKHLSEDAGIDMRMFSKTYAYQVYDTEVLQGQVAVPDASFEERVKENFKNTPVQAVKVSDANRILELQGIAPIDLPEGTFALNTVSENVTGEIAPYAADPSPIVVGGTELSYWGGPVVMSGLWTTNFASSDIFLIVPDAVAETLAPSLEVFVADYSGDTDVGDQIISSKAASIDNGSVWMEGSGPLYRMALGSLVWLNNVMVTASMVFVGLYIGMIFLVAGAAILALQMLSGASDDKPRYPLLNKLGASSEMIDKALLYQTALYFFLPLLVGSVHSVFGISFMTQIIGNLGHDYTVWSALMAALFIVGIYGVYFIATYFGCRRIVRARAVREE